jgi:hypothetical protein
MNNVWKQQKLDFLRPLLGYAKLDLQGNVDIRKCFSNCGPRRSTGSFRRKSIAKKNVSNTERMKTTPIHVYGIIVFVG